ncbi:MAG TPA: DUF2071 domain-containing protein [Pyrinomonadaceae bacterium]|nr:DUF2071 domain-containing protein [Pyrinomonadaceae bacterium]
MKKFLTAEWRDLIMANYEVDPALLASRVPHGTELDLQDGRCFVSLVGFMFLNTRVLGIPIPYHVNFEEVNLRFYVKRDTGTELRRGVVFVKEIVPRRAITFVARTLFGEPYETAIMRSFNDPGKVCYRFRTVPNIHTTKFKNIMRERIKVTRGDRLGIPAEGSHEEFIIEHYWGYTKRGSTSTDEYKVEHPKWELYATRHPKIEVKFWQWYGKEFKFLRDAEPYSILLAKGSPISVYFGERLR